MRKLLLILSLILICTNLGLAQGRPAGNPGNSGNAPGNSGNAAGGHDDHDDNSPIQSGYGVVTPVAATTSGTTTGLVVFESFGMRHNGGNSVATQAGVLPPDLTTNAVMFVDSRGRLSTNL